MTGGHAVLPADTTLVAERGHHEAPASLAPAVTGDILPRGFDYESLGEASSAKLREAAQRIHHRISRQIDHITQIGCDLIAAKSMLQHGQFTKWLASEFSWTERTVRNYMNVAEVFGGKTEKISVLRSSTLYRLAAPSTPAEARARIVAIAQTGQPVTEKLVASAIRRAKLDRDLTPDPELTHSGCAQRFRICRKRPGSAPATC